jgi:hypothetical protein
MDAKQCLLMDESDGAGKERRLSYERKLNKLGCFFREILPRQLYTAADQFEALVKQVDNENGDTMSPQELVESIQLLRDLAPVIRLVGDVADPHGGTPLRLELKQRRRGKPASPRLRRRRENAVQARLSELTRDGGKREAAILALEKEIGRSRSTISRLCPSHKKKSSS